MRSDIDFDRLVDQHYAELFRFAVSLAGNESDACDLVQETFYLLSAKSEQLKDPSKAKSWLFTTLFRLFTASRRRLIRFPQHELEQVESELPEIPPLLPQRFDWTVMATSLARLDEIFRAPVALFYLEQNSYGEIAEILNIPMGTVKSRIARGVAALQRMLVENERPTIRSRIS
jgi:RNA polymerase sigma-70 factor (ECF subfamily)